MAEVLTLNIAQSSQAQSARAALGVRLAAYRFDRYRTKEKPDAKPTIRSCGSSPTIQRRLEAALPCWRPSPMASRSRATWSPEPPNVLYPEEFARRVKELGSLGLVVEISGEAEMAKLGMNLLLAVGRVARARASSR